MTVSPPAFLIHEPLIFAALGEEELGDMDAGGQAVASFFSAANLTEYDRAFVAMAWERAFRQRHDEFEELAGPEEIEEEDGHAPAVPVPKRSRRRGKKQRRRKSPRAPVGPMEEPAVRELIDPSDVDLASLKVTMAKSSRKGQLRLRKSRPLKDPRRNRHVSPNGPRPSPGRPHIAQERESVGYELVADYLESEYGLELEDCRARTDIGADGVDHDEDLWMELKAHAGAPPDSIKLTASEAERAREKKDRYWLVVAAGLEKGHTPELIIIPNPLSRLDTYIGGGIRLIGIQAERRGGDGG